MDKLLLAPLEAAGVLGIGRSKLYELLRGGQLASVQIGGCRRITPATLTQYVDACKQPLTVSKFRRRSSTSRGSARLGGTAVT